ncbi:uncharacterized protein K441DRAFT_666730 [Cenococcum geophilum 1.58]|uniref:uncharacterized protein n=1 Tax=Cenococcum geophilum 1.58 TaxID=794803 RepID=UPI00358FD573|nr:hypothetical protein K441DRAFT_666730 [Cenococcum geophilum 1.58]
MDRICGQGHDTRCTKHLRQASTAPHRIGHLFFYEALPSKKYPYAFRQGSLRRTYTYGNAKKQRIGSVDPDSRILCDALVTFIGPHFASPAEKMRKPQDEELGRVAWLELRWRKQRSRYRPPKTPNGLASSDTSPRHNYSPSVNCSVTHRCRIRDRACGMRKMAKNTISNTRATATYSLQP